jgi:hypothetical protein
MTTAAFGTEKLAKGQFQNEIALRKELKAQGNFAAPEVKSLPVMEAIRSIPDASMRLMVEDTVMKAVESYDLTGIRFVSYFDQVAELVNTQTIFSDIVEGMGGIARSTDFQIRWRELYANSGATVEFFNLNAGLPSEAQMTRAVRGNTMGAYGNQLNIRYITEELAAQSPIASGFIKDERANQLRMQFARMKRFRNEKFLVNTEVKSEVVGDTPQWKGFYTDSTSNATATSGDLTAALIDTKVRAIANASSVEGLGYDVPLVALTTAAQIAKVRDIMIARFTNAESSDSYLANQERLKRMLPGVNLNPDMSVFYKTDPGTVVAFIHEPQLTSGVTLFFDPRQPVICKFQMMGQFGPWTLVRPTPELTTLLVAFDFESIASPLKASRASYSGLN